MFNFDKLLVINHRKYGLILGFIGPLLGVYIYSRIFFGQMTFAAFWRLFSDLNDIQGGVLSVAMIVNVIFFFVSIQILKFERLAQGVILATLAYLPLIVYLKYFH